MRCDQFNTDSVNARGFETYQVAQLSLDQTRSIDAFGKRLDSFAYSRPQRIDRRVVERHAVTLFLLLKHRP